MKKVLYVAVISTIWISALLGLGIGLAAAKKENQFKHLPKQLVSNDGIVYKIYTVQGIISDCGPDKNVRACTHCDLHKIEFSSKLLTEEEVTEIMVHEIDHVISNCSDTVFPHSVIYNNQQEMRDFIVKNPETIKYIQKYGK